MKRGILTLRRVHRRMVRYRRTTVKFVNDSINAEAHTKGGGRQRVITDLLQRREEIDQEMQRELDRPYIKNYS